MINIVPYKTKRKGTIGDVVVEVEGSPVALVVEIEAALRAICEGLEARTGKNKNDILNLIYQNAVNCWEKQDGQSKD